MAIVAVVVTETLPFWLEELVTSGVYEEAIECIEKGLDVWDDGDSSTRKVIVTMKKQCTV